MCWSARRVPYTRTWSAAASRLPHSRWLPAGQRRESGTPATDRRCLGYSAALWEPRQVRHTGTYTPIHTVWVKKYPLMFSSIFPKRSRIFSPNFTHLLLVSIYAGLQIFIQLSATLTKLCHIKRDHPVHYRVFKVSIIGRNSRWHFLTFSSNSWEFLVQILQPITRSYLR